MSHIGDNVDLSNATEVIFDPQLEKNEYPSDAIAMSGGRNLAAKYCTKEIWEAYKDLKSATAGFEFRQAINTGMKNPSSYVGCHFGDLDSYELFKEFYDNVIREYHGGYSPEDVHKTDMDPNNLKVDIEHKSYIISTRIRCARNLEGNKDMDFGLAPGMKHVEVKEAVRDTLKEAFGLLEGDLSGSFYSLETMSDEDRKQLIADHFLFKGADKMQADSGYHKWWPRGRGIFHTPDKLFLCWINEGDHLRIISMQKGGEVAEVFKRWCRAANSLEGAVKQVTGGKGFMHTEHLGYYNCCPSNLGTGLRAGVHVKLPKLLEALGMEKLNDICAKLHVQARGIHGEHSQSEGGIIDISNKYRIGHSEVELVTLMINGLNKLIAAERRLEAGEDPKFVASL